MVVAKVGLTGTCGDNQGVISIGAGELVLLGGHRLIRQIDISYLSVDEVDVVLIAQQLAGGRGNLTGGNHAGCYLIQHRLEQVVVLLIDEGDFHIGVLQLLNGVETTEAGANHDDVVAATVGAISGISHGFNATFLKKANV